MDFFFIYYYMKNGGWDGFFFLKRINGHAHILKR
jgi:hypothetical protein